MKIFVTGATGVIGRRAIPMMLERGYQVTAVARSAAKRAALEGVGAKAIEVDIFDTEALPRLVKGHDVIVNLATSVPASSKAILPFAWRAMGRIRKVVSNNLRIAAKHGGVERFIQESFAPIYADGGSAWLRETSSIAPARYNRAIVDAETAVAQFATSGGIGIVLRFGFFYGPDSDFSLDMINMVRKGRIPSIGSPDGYVSSVSHDDAASAVVHALGLQGGTYNVVDNNPVTKREFAEIIATTIQVPPPKPIPEWIRYLMGSLGETLSRSQRISNKRLTSTGWKAKYPSVRKGIPAMIREMRERGVALNG